MYMGSDSFAVYADLEVAVGSSDSKVSIFEGQKGWSSSVFVAVKTGFCSKRSSARPIDRGVRLLRWGLRSIRDYRRGTPQRSQKFALDDTEKLQLGHVPVSGGRGRAKTGLYGLEK